MSNERGYVDGFHPQHRRGRTAMEFRKWLRLRCYQIQHEAVAITIYKVENTLIRRIRLRNGETIETTITEKEGE